MQYMNSVIIFHPGHVPSPLVLSHSHIVLIDSYAD